MKSLYLTVLTLLFTVAMTAQDHPFGPKEGPRMNLEKQLFTMAKVGVGKTVTKTYEFINDGTEPLIISNMSTSCKCLVIDMPKEVAPGKKATLTLTFSPKRGGSFKETLYIKTNVKDAPSVYNFAAVAVK